MGGKSDTPPPPDYSGVSAASEANAKLSAQMSREQIEWAKEQFYENKDLLEQVLSTQLPIMESEAEAGAKLRDRYETVFQPIEDQLVKESNEYASGARSDYDAGKAIQSVDQAFDATRSSALARMESYGIDPSQTRSSALDAGIRVQEAAAKAAAGTQSRLNTENVGRALRSEAINLGKGQPSNIANAYGTAMAAGQQGLSGALQTTASGASTMGTGNQWMGTSNSGLQNWGNMIGAQAQGAQQSYQNKNEQSGQMGSAVGSLAGMAIGSMIMPGVGSALGSAIGGGVGKASGVAEGGEIPHDPNDPEGKNDTFAARLSGGEFVIPASAVRRLGSEHFDKLVAKYGDETDRKAATHRMQTGKPGGEPTQPETRRRAIQNGQMTPDRARQSALGMRAVA